MGSAGYRELAPWERPEPGERMTAAARLSAAAAVIALLVIAGLAQLVGLHGVASAAVCLFLLAGFGVGPLLLGRQLSAATFVLLSGAISTATATTVGLFMAWTGAWHPVVALWIAIVVEIVTIALAVRRDLGLLRGEPGRPLLSRAVSGPAALTVLALLLVVVDGVLHRGDPSPAGLFGTVGPLTYVGVVIALAAVVLAVGLGAGLAVPVVGLSSLLVLSQATVYGTPTVMAAGKHIGVTEFIADQNLTGPIRDIYQAWPGLFGSAAWAVGAIRVDPVTLAAWLPVLLTGYGVLAVRVLAGRFLVGERKPWIAAGLFGLGDGLNTVYFSPQSMAFVQTLVVCALLVGRPVGEAVAALWPRLALAAWVTCVLIVTHQISPFLLVAELVALVLFRLVQPWWTPVVVLVPAIGWALVHRSVLGGFVSLSAIGHIFTNISPPSHAGATLPEPVITRLTFDVPAVVLVVIGIFALVTVFRRRDRLSLGLLLAAVSPVSLIFATDYGSEGIFRVVLFALPWLAILAATALDGVAVPVLATRVAFAAGLVVLFAVNAIGMTGLDWARVVRHDDDTAIRMFENTAPPNATLLLVGTGNASPVRLTQHYQQVNYASRELLNDFPRTTGGYDAGADMIELTSTFARSAPNDARYALVSDAIGAWDDRYGLQTYADYEQLRAAFATSHGWTAVYRGATSTLYQQTGAVSVGGS